MNKIKEQKFEYLSFKLRLKLLKLLLLICLPIFVSFWIDNDTTQVIIEKEKDK
jgi:hypothetical protein